MDRYTIYCTEEQTKKAIKLGAPIERGHDGSRYFNPGVPTFFDKNDEICRVRNSVIFNPTAEQMLGWLEEQGITIESVRCDMFWFAPSYIDENANFNKGRFSSRKEATLAAIDAALDYLIKQ